jgi:hypothetical protein
MGQGFEIEPVPDISPVRIRNPEMCGGTWVFFYYFMARRKPRPSYSRIDMGEEVTPLWIATHRLFDLGKSIKDRGNIPAYQFAITKELLLHTPPATHPASEAFLDHLHRNGYA